MIEAASLGVIDTGTTGNLRSVVRVVSTILDGAPTTVETPEDLGEGLSGVLLPGVGHFDSVRTSLAERGLDEVLRRMARAGDVPILGICLGMQILLGGSAEGSRAGLGLISGTVERLVPVGRTRVPHVGWNTVRTRRPNPLMRDLDGAEFYFTHSYAVPSNCGDAAGVTEYGTEFASVVHDGGSVFGVQFHPEKSHAAGRKLLGNFLEDVCSAPG